MFIEFIEEKWVFIAIKKVRKLQGSSPISSTDEKKQHKSAAFFV